jgi:hypothetical protein
VSRFFGVQIDSAVRGFGRLPYQRQRRLTCTFIPHPFALICSTFQLGRTKYDEVSTSVVQGWSSWQPGATRCILVGMAAAPNRLFLDDVRGGDLYLRVTWHPESATIVFSHWNGEICLASTPIALTDATKLIDLQVRALSEVATRRLSPVEAPRPRTVMERIKDRLRPRLADVIDASTRFLPTGRKDHQTGSPL